jgi:hypothetical protein
MKRPQISIRSLLWLMVVLAVALGWLADRRQLEGRLSATETTLAQERQFAKAQREYSQAEQQELLRSQTKNLSATHWRYCTRLPMFRKFAGAVGGLVKSLL